MLYIWLPLPPASFLIVNAQYKICPINHIFNQLIFSINAQDKQGMARFRLVDILLHVCIFHLLHKDLGW